MKFPFLLTTRPIFSNLPHAVRHFFTRRGLLICAGALVCLYALAVLFFVQAKPDLGLRSIFSTEIKGSPRYFQAQVVPQDGDTVERIGGMRVASWPNLLSAPFSVREQLAQHPDPEPTWVRRVKTPDDDEEKVVVEV